MNKMALLAASAMLTALALGSLFAHILAGAGFLSYARLVLAGTVTGIVVFALFLDWGRLWKQ